MKNALFLLLFLLKNITPTAAQTVIFFNEKTASPIEIAAVQTLQNYLGQMTGQTPRVIWNAESRPGSRVIFIQNNPYLSGFGLKMPETVPKNGFFYESKNNAALLVGGGEHGLEHAVFAFLEKMGCRKFVPGEPFLPKLASDWRLPEIAPKTETPAFAWRELHYQNAFDEKYAQWHGLLQNQEKRRQWGLFVHTFNRLCPPDLFFEKNPEWFSFNGAQRVADGQLCLTNVGVKNQVIAALRDSILKKPEAQFWSVSQNDNFNFCKCENCRASDEKLGGPSGTMVAFVNAIAAEFPQKTISTLAYQYTRAAPKNIRPAANVNIMFCSIECNRGEPIATDASSAGFRADFENWAALTSNFYLWDYVVDFRSYQCPFPNLGVLQPNLAYFKKFNPEMVFEQGSGRDRSEFSDLRAYLLAKWLWNPALDRDSLMTDFLEGVYGDAAPFLKKYILKQEERLAETDRQLWIYAVPAFYRTTYLRDEDLILYENLFDAAENAVKTGSQAWQNVRRARLPLMFARLELAKTGEPSLWAEADGKVLPDPKMAALRLEFLQGCQSYGIENLHEGGYPPRDYGRDLMRFAIEGKQNHLAAGRPVLLKNPASKNYQKGNPALLTDRLLGETDYHFNWIGFEGTDMEAVIELPKAQKISHLETHFLQDQQSWIFFPEKILLEISKNGSDWETIFQQKIDPKASSEKKVETIKTSINSQKMAKFVRIRAINLKKCPDWHSCNGSACWLFCDEILVR